MNVEKEQPSSPLRVLHRMVYRASSEAF